MPETEPIPFEQALASLERILRDLEEGSISLEDALVRYERGVVLLRHCYGQLKDAEQRIRLLTGTTDDGSADLKLFDHVASIENAKASVRRPIKPPHDPGIPR
jgi:exodeoxyribonuclease VII small subunit